MRGLVALGVVLWAIAAQAQAEPDLTPRGDPERVPLVEPPSVAEPPSAAAFASRSEAQTGWSRPGGILGIGLATVPIGFAIGSVVASYKLGLSAQEWTLVAAGLLSPLVALVPTFAGRSAIVDDDHAHKPRLLRILGWVAIGFGTFSLLTSPIVGRLLILVKLSDGSPSIFGSFFNILDGGLASLGVLLISIASLVSAHAAEQSVVPQRPAAWASRIQLTPLIGYLPALSKRESGSLITGVAASF